jgi:hypothetical protein
MRIELLLHFLQQWSGTITSIQPKQTSSSKPKQDKEETESMKTMAYNIRRLIVPCLLSNTRSGLEDIKVFRRMMKIITELWCKPHYRRHLKIEIGVLIEHFVLKILRLGPQVLPPKRLSKTSSNLLNDFPVSLLPQQVCIVNEIKIWFLPEPRDILELYLNFDQVDANTSKKNFRLLPSTHWKITQQLCGALCTLAEQCTEIVSEQIKLTRTDLAGVESQSSSSTQRHHTEEDLKEMSHVREGARFLQEKCFDAIGQMVRSVMLCSAASSGASYNLFTKLREKKIKDETMKNAEEEAERVTESKIEDDNNSESSVESDDNMTVKSISTIGNIVGGIMSKKKDKPKVSTMFEVPATPRTQRASPPEIMNEDRDIVEYWQTSIAAERKNKITPSSKTGHQDTSNSNVIKPPRSKRAGSRSVPPLSTPPRAMEGSRKSTLLRNKSPQNRSPKRDDASIVSFADESTMRGDPLLSQKVEEKLNVAFEIVKTKGLKKALDFLIACGFLIQSPRDVASFLRLHQPRIDTAILGDYLGEGGKDGDEVEYFNQIRFNYFSAISFVGLNVEQG